MTDAWDAPQYNDDGDTTLVVTEGLNIIVKDPSRYTMEMTVETAVPKGGYIKIIVPAGVGSGQTYDGDVSYLNIQTVTTCTVNGASCTSGWDGTYTWEENRASELTPNP